MLRFFKVMSDESRLRILGIVAGRESSVEELAETVGLKAPTVSHHLAKLRELGLVTMRPEGNTHLYRLDAEALRALSKEVLPPSRIASLTEGAGSDAWERKVLRDFFEGERLREIPASLRKRLVVLRWLAQQFQPSVRYHESQVNEIIKRYHHDFATLRRELVGNCFLVRESGLYWRVGVQE